MSTVKKLSTGTENYPKAGTRRFANRRPKLNKTHVSTPSVSSGPTLDIKRNYPTTDRVDLDYSNGLDSDVESMRKLSRQNLNGHSSGGSPKGGGETRGSTKRVKVRKRRTGGGGGTTKPNRANSGTKSTGSSGADAPSRSSGNTNRPARSVPPRINHGRNEHANAIVRGARNKQLEYERNLQKPQQKKNKPAPKKTTAKNSSSKTRTKAKAGGVFKILGGGVDIYQGIGKIVEGDMEGGLQIGQGLVNSTEGVHAVRTAECVTDTAKKGMGKALQRVGVVANAGMAVWDAKQSYDAYKNGNEVKAAEEASSAIINTVSSFPPTAVIGMIGGLADFAMEASGGDDAMVHLLTSGSRAKYANQAHQERCLALDLIKTKSSKIRSYSPAKKRKMARGLVGMREYYKKLIAEENPNAGFIYEHIARVKADLTGRN